MKRKFFSCFMFAALMGAGMISVTSCADYDEDIRVVQQQVTENATMTQALQAQVNGMEAQIKALQDALNAIKSCQCGDVDKKIADAISAALAGLDYTTPAQVADAINKALEGLNTGLTAEEVQALIDAYHKEHPNCTCGDIQALIEKYLKENPGLSEGDVQNIIKAYLETHPVSTLTENDVKAIVETYINQLQHFTKEEILAMINTAIAQALAGYQPGVSADEAANIAATVIEKYMKDHPYTLDTEAVKAICNTTIENSVVINNIKGSISELSETLETVKTALENLKNNVYTKTEVEALINTLIQKAINENNKTLTSEQQTIVNNLIAAAIDAYAAAHPECNCQYDAAAFKAIADQVAANTEALKGIVIPDVSNFVTNNELEAAINEVKGMIPEGADLSKYVTIATLNELLTEVNIAISNADGKAQEALDKANALGGAVSDLQTAVTNLNNLYIDLNTQFADISKKAIIAFDRSLSNYFEIQALKELYQQLLSRVGALEDNTAMKDEIQKIKDQLENFVTREELETEVGKLEDAVDAAKNYAKQEAADAAAKALSDAKEYTDTEIGKLKLLYKEDAGKYDNRFKDIEKDIKDIKEHLDQIDSDLENFKKVTDYVSKLITNIELQGTKNPAFGYFSLPMGITSNILIAYYGENEHDTYFPAIDDYDLVYDDPENWITAEDYARLGVEDPFEENWQQTGGTTFIGTTGNAGKLYLTVNPSSVDFSGTTFKLVNSIGEESPVTLGKLAHSTDKLHFGQSRAEVQNGFYEAPATVTEANLECAKYQVNDQTTAALEDIAKNKLNSNLSNIAQAIYNELNGKLDAYAVQASWTDNLGEHNVTSKYNIAATAIKPLSYSFMHGISFKLPTITPLSELNIDLKKYIDLSKLNFDINDFDLNIKVKVDFSDLHIDAAGNICSNITVTEANKHYTKEDCIIINASEINDKTAIKDIVAVFNKQSEAWSAQLSQEFEEQLGGKIESIKNQINDLVNGGKLQGTVNGLLDKVSGMLNSALNATDPIVNGINSIIGKLNVYLENPNLRLQTHLMFEGQDGFFHPMSTAAGIPTTFYKDGGEGINLYINSYSGEFLVPSYKKFIAVTNVYKDGKNADTDPALMKALKTANSVEYFNKVIDGDRYAVVFAPDKSVSNATYEIVYSSLDFHGKISQRKYYVTVK